ncbi:hypothetical protein C7B67_16360 [filamentous cyanobacterium Phorm 6]|nr:hypothetical protein C7B67_16360 [filamentous cyanobacterium Phorm 6]
MNKNQEKHDRIKNLTYGAIVRGDITTCDRQPDDTYIITRTSDLKPITHTTNSAVIFLYLLKCSSQAEE